MHHRAGPGLDIWRRLKGVRRKPLASLALFFYGLIPLMFFARSAKQAGWIGAVVATLGTLILVMGLIVFRSSI